MSHIIYTGIIGCDMSEDFFQTTTSNKLEKLYWKKIFVSNNTLSSRIKTYPGVEIVDTVEAIANDKEISLVIVASNHLGFVKPIIDAGKAIRVI